MTLPSASARRSVAASVSRCRPYTRCASFAVSSTYHISVLPSWPCSSRAANSSLGCTCTDRSFFASMSLMRMGSSPYLISVMDTMKMTKRQQEIQMAFILPPTILRQMQTVEQASPSQQEMETQKTPHIEEQSCLISITNHLVRLHGPKLPLLRIMK